jgi:hypothetical protein
VGLRIRRCGACSTSSRRESVTTAARAAVSAATAAARAKARGFGIVARRGQLGGVRSSVYKISRSRRLAARRAGQHRRRRASHEVIDYLTELNTTPEHGRRGRRVEYTIGWPVDERTMGGIERLREGDWGVAVHPDGEPDPDTQSPS